MEKEDFLSKEDSELIIELIEALLHVNKREQFFGWLQGSFQSLLPHEILICGARSKNRSQLHFLNFSSTRYFGDYHLKMVTNEDNGILIRLIKDWKINNRPILIGSNLKEKKSGFYRVPFEVGLELLRETELINIAAHGLLDNDGDVVTFFSFCRIPGEINPRYAYLLELLVPQIHSAFLRVFRDGGNLFIDRKSVV